MRLEVREDSKNYACTVIRIKHVEPVTGLDNLVKTTIFGNDVLIHKDTDVDQLFLFFPAECAISAEYLSKNNEFRESGLNRDRSQSGYFEPSGRVKAVKFKGVISTGYIAPLSTLEEWYDPKGFKEGDEFTTIEGFDLCKKYKPARMQGSGADKESRHNKKLKRFDKLVPNQFRFHQDTSHLAKNLHLFNPDDIIVITDKWHGTSTVHSNILVNKDLNWFQRLVVKLIPSSIKKHLDFKTYDNIYSSRSVVKNQYINREQGGGYYGEDIWAVVNKELNGKIEQGITLYGEIVGYLPSGKAIQGGYDYGCKLNNVKDYPMPTDGKPISLAGLVTTNEHKFLVYRITYTKPNGEVIEFSWQQIKEYCKKYSIEHVKQIYFGTLRDFVPLIFRLEGPQDRDYSEKMFDGLQTQFLEKDCTHCKNKVPAEGVVVRIDGKPTYSTFKLKSKRFLEHETKSIDKGEISIEDEQTGDYET